MAVDYPGAIDMMLPLNYSFNAINPLAIVQHSTGGDMTLDAVHNTFLSTMRSTHFAIDRNGAIAQFVPLNRGAGGNCCPDSSHDHFWDSLIQQYSNLNLCTISIEHCNDSFQSLTMTPAQMDASNKLTLWLCQKFNIPSGAIKGHDSIDNTNCPGKVFYATYWQQMINYVNQGLQPQVNPNQRKAFETEWRSIQPQASVTSGIANAAWADYQNNIFHGPALTLEFPSVDWNGNPIIVQVTAGGRYEWNNGQANFYRYQ